MIKTVNVFGAVGDQFGHSHSVSADSISTAVRAIDYQHNGFKNAIRAGEWMVEIDGVAVDKDNLNVVGEVVDLFPVVTGSKSNAQRNLAIGGTALLLTAAVIATGGTALAAYSSYAPWIAQSGVLALTYSELLGANQLDFNSSESAASIETNSVSNEGAVIPLVYGKMRVTPLRISLEVTNERRV